jgi:hypothetical protein
MLPAIGIALIVVAVAFAIWFGARRRPRQDAGIVGFRKHIDALSPESRREVQDRVRERKERDDPNGGHS